MKSRLKRLAGSVYNYHNLGVGVFPEGEEKTPYGSGERYNYDRMYMLASNYEFTNKNIVDLGCNSGWFCIQAKFLGTNVTVGIDYEKIGVMGGAIRYAIEFEKRFKFGIDFVNCDLQTVNLRQLARKHSIDRFDASFLLSTLHHISNKDDLFAQLFEMTRDVIFYEDHEFWNDLIDEHGNSIPVKGQGYRYGWNEDMSWQRKLGPLESYEPKIIDAYRNSWRSKTLMLDQFQSIRFLGFSEKRRPLLALFKRTAP